MQLSNLCFALFNRKQTELAHRQCATMTEASKTGMVQELVCAYMVPPCCLPVVCSGTVFRRKRILSIADIEINHEILKRTIPIVAKAGFLAFADAAGICQATLEERAVDWPPSDVQGHGIVKILSRLRRCLILVMSMAATSCESIV